MKPLIACSVLILAGCADLEAANAAFTRSTEPPTPAPITPTQQRREFPVPKSELWPVVVGWAAQGGYHVATVDAGSGLMIIEGGLFDGSVAYCPVDSGRPVSRSWRFTVQAVERSPEPGARPLTTITTNALFVEGRNDFVYGPYQVACPSNGLLEGRLFEALNAN